MAGAAKLLEIERLSVRFPSERGPVQAVDGLSLSLLRGETVGLVGESGCGKSVTGLSLMGLNGPGAQVSGSARLAVAGAPVELVGASAGQLRALRGRQIAMVFQEPGSCLNPVLSVGRQLEEALALYFPRLSRRERRARAVEMLAQAGVARPQEVVRCYAHELSGGMRQRVLIAMAVCAGPSLLVCDEPTTALDVTTQAQILELLEGIQRQLSVSMLFITHDLGVVAHAASRVAVMYAGRVVEEGGVREIFHDARHPYTQGLLASRPWPGRRGQSLPAIPGQVISPIGKPDRCDFWARCRARGAVCAGPAPEERWVSPGHRVACWRGGERDG